MTTTSQTILTGNELLKQGCPTLAGNIAATLADPDVMPAAQPITGNYIQVLDAPSFISPTSLINFDFSENAVTFISDIGELAGSGEFESTTKEITVSGSSITIVDPNKTGYQSFVGYRSISSFISNQAELARWHQQGCPGTIKVTTYSGFERFTLL